MHQSPWYQRSWSFAQESWEYFMSFRPTRMASSLSYYAVFSLAPLLVITFWLGNFLVEADSWGTDIVSSSAYVIGPQSADFIQTTFTQAATVERNALAAFIAIALLVFLAAQGVGELKKSLDEIWQAPKEIHTNFFQVLSRFLVSFVGVLSFGMVFVVYVLALKLFERGFSFGVETGFGRLVTIFGGPVMLFLITFLGTLVVYQILPSERVPAQYRLLGAFFTGLLLAVGNIAIGYYMSHGVSLSAYGVAGSVIALLVWFYYSSLIFLLGASTTWVYAKRSGYVPPKQ